MGEYTLEMREVVPRRRAPARGRHREAPCRRTIRVPGSGPGPGPAAFGFPMRGLFPPVTAGRCYHRTARGARHGRTGLPVTGPGRYQNAPVPARLGEYS